jgi:hypothetical protein
MEYLIAENRQFGAGGIARRISRLPVRTDVRAGGQD